MTEDTAKSHPGVLAGTHYAFRASSRPGGWYVQSKASIQRYQQSERGRDAWKRRDFKRTTAKEPTA